MARLRAASTRTSDGDDEDEGEGDEGDAKYVAGRFRRTVDTRGLVGAIIGKNGSTIKRLERVTRTRMEVDQDTKSVTVHSKTEKGVKRGCELGRRCWRLAKSPSRIGARGSSLRCSRISSTAPSRGARGEKGEAPAEVSPEGTEVKGDGRDAARRRRRGAGRRVGGERRGREAGGRDASRGKRREAGGGKRREAGRGKRRGKCPRKTPRQTPSRRMRRRRRTRKRSPRRAAAGEAGRARREGREGARPWQGQREEVTRLADLTRQRFAVFD